MKSRLGKGAVLAIFVAMIVAMGAAADTLELKDRRVIKGKYLGGTQANVRFRVHGRIELYPVSDIVALTFDGEGDPDPGTETGTGPASALSDGGAPQAANLTVPAGTRIVVRMIDTVDSEKNKVGDRFRASLEQDLMVKNTVVAPKGADVYGRLSEAKEAGHISGKSELKLELTDIVINGRMQPVMSGDYNVSGHSRGASTAKRVGGGAALGAAIGAIAGGGKGAAVGAGVGAGAGTAVQVLTRGEQVRIPSETMLEFRIEHAFTVEAPASGGR